MLSFFFFKQKTAYEMCGRDWSSDVCSSDLHTRIPAGHPEGYLEAFANIYRNFAYCLRAQLSGKKVKAVYRDFPTVDDGIRGMRFIEKVVASSRSKQKWIKF